MAVIAVTLSFVMCNLVYYLISQNHTVIVLTEISSYILAIIIVVLHVRCYPLSFQERQRLPFFQVRLLQ